MPIIPKDWKNLPDPTTEISAEALEDLETRTTAYADTLTKGTFNAASYPTLQAALDAAAGGTLIIPPQTYTNVGSLTVSNNTKVIARGATFVCANRAGSSGQTAGVVHFGTAPYTLANPKSFTVDGVKNAVTITLSPTDAATFSPGDPVGIRDETLLGGVPCQQETNYVESVSGGTVTLRYPLNFSYAVAQTATIAKFPTGHGTNIHWYGGTFDLSAATDEGTSASDHTTFNLWSCENCTVNDVDVHHFVYKVAQVHRSLHCKIRNCRAWAPTVVTAGRGYNSTIDNSRFCTLEGLWGMNVRHVADIAGGSDCIIDRCFGFGRTTDNQTAFFLHGTLSKRCHITNCIADNMEVGVAAGNGTFGPDYDFTIANVTTYRCDHGMSLSQQCTGWNAKVKTVDSVQRGVVVDGEGYLDADVDGVLTNPAGMGAIDMAAGANVTAKVRVRNAIRYSVSCGSVTRVSLVNPDIEHPAGSAFAAVNFGPSIGTGSLHIEGGRINCANASSSAVQFSSLAGTPLHIHGTSFNGTMTRAVSISGPSTDMLIKDIRVRGTVSEAIRLDGGTAVIEGCDFSSTTGITTAIRLATSAVKVTLRDNQYGTHSNNTFNNSTSGVIVTDREVINVGNMGASYALNMAGRTDVLVTGTLNANCTITVSNETPGCRYSFALTQDATGGRTVTLPTAIAPAGAISVVPTALATTQIDYQYDGTNRYATSTYADPNAILIAKHILGRATSSTVSVAAAGIGASVVTASGQGAAVDSNGAFDVTISGTPAANSAICTITFNTTYFPDRPAIVLTPRNLAAAQAVLFVSSTFTNQFTVSVVNAPAAAALISFNYVVLGAASGV